MSNRTKINRRSAAVVGTLGTAMLLATFANAANAATAAAPKAPTKPVVACAPVDGITPTSITIGFISPKTGPAAANFAGAEQAARLRIDQENAKGGIFGRKIKLIGYDDQANGSVQTGVANQAVQQDKVFGIVLASAADSMMPFLKANNVPVTGFNVLALATDRNTFGISGPTVQGVVSTAPLERLKQAGVTKAAFIAHSTPGAVNSIKSIAAAVGASGTGITNGITILDEAQGTHDATSTALRLKNAGVDGSYESMFVDGGISIAQALAQQGVKLKANYLVGLSDPSVIAKAAGPLEGMIGSTYGTTPAGVPGKPGVRTFVNGMKAAGLNPYTAIAPVGYAATDLMITGLKKAGKCPTRDSFINNLRKVKNFTANGMLPVSTSFAPGVTPLGSPSKCTWFLTVKNGVPVPDKAVTCGKLVDTTTNRVVG
ncbi:MAG: ABC transporter substrate-binding protein [Candidatus Nanopelagicales bacterium]